MEGIDKDYKKAVKYFEIAAANGSDCAKNHLGVRYREGEGVEKDLEKAYQLFYEAAQNEYAPAQRNISECYFNGIGVQKDAGQAVYWAQKAAEQGDAQAQFRMGYCYEHGEGIATDKKKAVKWYEQAASQDHREAHYCIAEDILHKFCDRVKEGREKHSKRRTLKKAALAAGAVAVGVAATNPIVYIPLALGGAKVVGKLSTKVLLQSLMSQYSKEMKQFLQTPDGKKMLAHYKAAADLGHEGAKKQYDSLMDYLKEK